MEVDGHRRSPSSSDHHHHHHQHGNTFWSPSQTANIGHHHIHDNEFLVTNHPDPGMILDHHQDIESTTLFIQANQSPTRDPYRYYHQYYHQHYHHSNRQLETNLHTENSDLSFLDRSNRGNPEVSNSSPRFHSTYQDPDSTVIEPLQDHESSDIIPRDGGHECPAILLNHDRDDYRRQTVEGEQILV